MFWFGTLNAWAMPVAVVPRFASHMSSNDVVTPSMSLREQIGSHAIVSDREFRYAAPEFWVQIQFLRLDECLMHIDEQAVEVTAFLDVIPDVDDVCVVIGNVCHSDTTL
jgi:hypothetical protein